MMRKFGYGAATLAAGLAMVQAAPMWAHARGLAGPARPVTGQHAGGRSGQSYLGIDVRDVSDDERTTLKLKDSHGAEIIKVDHDGPAGKMGLREHDVVIQMNGVVVDGEEQMRRMLHDTAPGHKVVLVISRDGQQLSMTAQMADRVDVERQAWEQHLSVPAYAGAAYPVSASGPQLVPADEAGAAAAVSVPVAPAPAPRSNYSKSFLGSLLTSPTYTGAIMERVGPQLGSFFGVTNGTGLLVRSVDTNSPAAMAGIKAGDVAIRANARTLATPTDWVKTIREAKGRPVTVIVVRDRQEKTVTLTPDIKHKSSLEFPLGAPEDAPAVAEVRTLRAL